MVSPVTGVPCSTVKKRRYGSKLSTVVDDALCNVSVLGDTGHNEESTLEDSSDMVDSTLTPEILSQTGICKSQYCMS